MVSWDQTFAGSVRASGDLSHQAATDELVPIALSEVYAFIQAEGGEEPIRKGLSLYRRTLFFRSCWPLLIYGVALSMTYWQAFLRATGVMVLLIGLSAGLGLILRYRRGVSPLGFWVLLSHPVLIYGLVLGFLDPSLFLNLTGMILLLMLGSGAAYLLNHRTEHQRLLEQYRCLLQYRPLLEEAKWFNATLEYLRVDDRMVEIGNPSQLRDKEKFTQYLKEIRAHLVRALKTQRLLNEHPHFRRISRTRNIPTAANDVFERASEYSRSINDVLEVDLSAYLEAKEKLWQI